MIIDIVSDLHGHFPKLDGGDLLILAGDYTAHDFYVEYMSLNRWMNSLDYSEIIFIAGNHDNLIQKTDIVQDILWDHTYLCDSGTSFKGLKVWGSPWTRTFDGMNPNCKAFTFETEEELSGKFGKIPTDTDILITHSPPFTILDRTVDGKQVGSTALMAEHLHRIRPKLWAWGHIHEAHGVEGPYQWNSAKYVNASYVDENYRPRKNPIIRIEI